MTNLEIIQKIYLPEFNCFKPDFFPFFYNSFMRNDAKYYYKSKQLLSRIGLKARSNILR